MSNRRRFLFQCASVVAAPLLSVAPVSSRVFARSSKRLRVLILGGTGFIGPHFVNAAVARGHDVAVFNRGITGTRLPSGVEHLLGDRNGDMHAIEHRDWDAVLDLATYVPRWIKSIGVALRGRVGSYTFISSIAVYESPASNPTTAENAPLLAMPEGLDAYTSAGESGGGYGALKVACELEAKAQFPGSALILRPGYIVGPGDPQGAFAYWAVRMKKGGQILACGDPLQPVQFIDVRDLAEWCFQVVERGVAGVYNVVGPVHGMHLGQLVSASSTTRISHRVTWLPSQWLSGRDDSYLWRYPLFWSALAGSMRMSIQRSLELGLTLRPTRETVVDSLVWTERQPPVRQSEIEVSRKTKGGSENMKISWDAYVRREHETIAAWRAERR